MRRTKKPRQKVNIDVFSRQMRQQKTIYFQDTKVNQVELNWNEFAKPQYNCIFCNFNSCISWSFVLVIFCVYKRWLIGVDTMPIRLNSVYKVFNSTQLKRFLVTLYTSWVRFLQSNQHCFRTLNTQQNNRQQKTRRKH